MKRHYSLDFLKVLAMILMIFHHFQQTFNIRFSGINFYEGSFAFGYLVELFFIISGILSNKYIDIISKKEISAEKFLIGKYLRFFPIVAVSVFAMTIVEMAFKLVFGEWRTAVVPTIWGILSGASCIWSGWYTTSLGINNPTWYISVLLLCYFIFYFTTAFSSWRGFNPRIVFFLVITIGLGIERFGIEMPFFNSSSSRGYYAFFWGLLLPDLFFFIRKIRGAKVLALLLSIIIPTCICYKGWVVPTSWYDCRYVCTFLLFPAIIFSLDDERIDGVLGKMRVDRISNIIFDTFVWHAPVLTVAYGINTFFDLLPSIPSAVFMVITTFFAFAVGLLSYYCLNIPTAKKCKTIIESIE